jgi:hypothetical protein
VSSLRGKSLLRTLKVAKKIISGRLMKNRGVLKRSRGIGLKVERAALTVKAMNKYRMDKAEGQCWIF